MNSSNRQLLFFSLILFLLLLFPSVGFSEAEVSYASKIDWRKGELEIAVDVQYSPESEKMRMRNNSENLFDDEFFDIFINSISNTADRKVFFNSRYTMAEMIQNYPLILNKIELIKDSAVMVYNVYHDDMSGVKMLYRINMFKDVSPYFIRHKIPQAAPEKYLWVPNEKYTGVVIYAKGEFPVRGESGKSSLNPSLFPSVYSKDMEKIITAEMVDPEHLVKWGIAGFTDKDDDPLILERAGDHPLYTMAEQIFGRNRTDLVVPSEIADLLFYGNMNADLIKEGRFIIIADLP